jgi:predicted amidohydrolase YtcJ
VPYVFFLAVSFPVQLFLTATLNRAEFIVAGITFTNGNIVTIDESIPAADTVVIRQDRIAYVGWAQGAAPYQDPGTEIIDLDGKTLIPGFNDNHLHAIYMGDYFSRPNLSGLDKEQIIEKLLAVDKTLDKGQTLYAFGWDYPSCPNPHRKHLDRVFPERPVALFQYSGHAVWVNTVILKKLKVTANTPDPPGGKIEKDSAGEPTGILKDKAAYPVHYKRFMQTNLRPKLRAGLIDTALALFRENGMTSVQDNTWSPPTVSHFQRLKRRGALTARVSCWSRGEPTWSRIWLEHKRYDPYWVRKGPRKFFIDGTFSTRTAMLESPYRGEPENFGLPAVSPKKLHHEIRKGIQQQRQLALHAIGDRAIRQFLDTLENFKEAKTRVRALRFRLEHAQLIARRDLERLADWSILLAVQPSALINLKKDQGLLGEERAARAYAFKSILEAGIPLSFGSDVPGESRFKPLELIQLAVNRQIGEKITPYEALEAYTKGSAYAEFMETEKGTLTPGKLADCVVLSEDPTRCPPNRIRDIRVEMTITGGKIVYGSVKSSRPSHFGSGADPVGET